LRGFSRKVDAISAGPGETDADTRRAADAAGVPLLPVPARLDCDADACTVTFDDGSTRRYDTLYPVLGSEAQSQLARELGADVDEDGALRTDAHQQTSVDGLYAIGDVVSALDQIAVAVGHAAIAATSPTRRPRGLRHETRVLQPGIIPAMHASHPASTRCSAFAGQRLLAAGTLQHVALAARQALDSDPDVEIRIFEDAGQHPVEVNLGGTMADLVRR